MWDNGLVYMPKPRYNQNVTVTIQSLGINGEGVGRWHGYTLFVDGALPGEEVRGRITHCERTFGRMQVTHISTPSPERVSPPCPLFGRCGGCQLMHLNYAQQLILKQKLVVKAMERVGKLNNIPVQECLPSPSPLGYRNKIQLPVVGKHIGLYARNSHDLVDVKECLVHCALGENVYGKVAAIVKASEIDALRYILIKSAVNTGQVLVTLVTTGEGSEILNTIAKAIMEQCPEVRGVVQNVKESDDNVVLGKEFRLLCGESSIVESLCGIRFKISPASFFQVNTAQAENLYQKALELADLTGVEECLDAYCGVGTLSLLIAQQAKHVVGIECVPEAISDAMENAKENSICNVDFQCGNAEDIIKTLQPIDVAFLNPPRKGCEKSFLEQLSRLAPKKIVYISCDPGTLARDMAYLIEQGYAVKTVQPFDMFPQTAHVESVTLLEKS